MTHDNHPSASHGREASSSTLDIAVTFGAERLTDARLLAALLDSEREGFAAALLEEVGSLASLHGKGPLELLALGLSEAEVTRLHLLGEYLERVLRHRHLALGSAQEFAVNVMKRAATRRWTQEQLGLTGVDGYGRIVLDRTLFTGSRCDMIVCVSTVMRESLLGGCEGIVVYRWHPGPMAEITRADLALCDEIRMAASIVRIRIVDYLVICHQECVSVGIGQQWVD